MEEGDVFLDGYTGQSVEELIALQKTHRIDSLVLAFESALDTKKESGQEVSGVELVILAVESLEREVGNGGYSQFFYNSSVEYAPIIVDSLRSIGCNKIADLTQKAIDLLAVESFDPEKIEERMDPDDEELEDSLSKLDDIYFNEVDDVPGYALFNHIKNSRERIKLA